MITLDMHFTRTFRIEDINKQLERILDSPAFRSSPTLTKFLTYIVSETLLEREQHIKEYNIAINVLNRSRDFNSQDDAVVRIHAGRLRRALNDYYLINGIHDPIIIHIPKGGYIPQFESRTPGAPAAIIPSVSSRPAINPVVAVFPFHIMPQKQTLKTFSLILAEQLGAELSRFQDLTVIGYYSRDTLVKIEENILEAAKSVRADYIITGSLQYADQRLRIFVNLLIASTGEVLMVKFFEKRGMLAGIFEMQDEIIESVIGAIGGYYDVIFQETAKVFPGKIHNSNLPVLEAVSIYCKYKESYSVESYNAALSAMQQVVKDHPKHAVSWAILCELQLDGIALHITNADDGLTLPYQYALRAVEIDRCCQHAWYALAWAHLFRKEKEACLYAARQCIELNPNSSVLVVGAAFMLICAGYFAEGFSIIEKGVKPVAEEVLWRNVGGTLYHLQQKDYASALLWAEKIDAEHVWWDPLLKCICLSYLNKQDDARKYLAKLLIIEPEAPRKIRAMLSTLLLSDELILHILDGLRNLDFEEETVLQVN